MAAERIANRQFFIILFVTRSVLVISLLLALTSADAAQDAWLSILLFAMPVTLLLVGSLAFLGTRFPRQTLTQYSITILGPYLGRAVAAFFLWIFLFFAALDARIYAVVLITGFLPETPLIFIVSSMILIAALAAFLGLEVIGRMADIIFPIFLITALLSILLPLPLADLGNLQPILARGWAPVVRGSLAPIGVAIDFSILAYIVPAATRPRRVMTWALGAVVASMLLSVISMISVITVRGAEEAARTVFPLLTMVRSVRISIFLERVEVLTIFAWGLGVFIALSSFVYSGARCLSQFFNVKDYRPMVLPMAVIWITLSVHMLDDTFHFRSLMNYRVMGPYGILLLAVPLVILWIAYGIRSLLRRLGLPGALPAGPEKGEDNR